MGRRASVAFLSAVWLVGCTAIAGLEPLEFLGSSPDGSDDSPGDRADDSPTADGPVTLDGARAPADSGTSFCANVDARVCTDFNDDASAGTPWRTAFPDQTIAGMGVPVPPHLETSAAYAEHGPYLVTTFVPDSGNPGFHANARFRSDVAPGWDGGVPPARRYEFKIFVKRSSSVTQTDIVTLDPVYSITVGLAPDVDGGPCAVLGTRGMAALPIADLFVPQLTWTKVVVDLPAAETSGGKPMAPTYYDVTVEVPGQTPTTKRAEFNSPALTAATKDEMFLGLSRPNGNEGAWEIWYDDVAISY